MRDTVQREIQMQIGTPVNRFRFSSDALDLSYFIRSLASFLLTLTTMLAQQPHSKYDYYTTDDAQIDKIVHRITLKEKVQRLFSGEQPGVAQLPGDLRLGIPAMFPSDGPRGIAAATGTAFLSGLGLAMSWDPSLFKAGARSWVRRRGQQGKR